MKCPYNPHHVKFVEEMPLHIQICPDLLNFGTHAAGKRPHLFCTTALNFSILSVDELPLNDATLALNKLNHRDVAGQEDWDEDHVPTTYNPVQKLFETRL